MSLDILAIAAHPDDIEQTCGGTLIRMAERGYRTGALDLTAGDMGTRGTPEQRIAEAEAAGRHLRLAWRGNLRFPDARLENTISSPPPSSWSTGLAEISARARRHMILISPRDNFSDSGLKMTHVV